MSKPDDVHSKSVVRLPQPLHAVLFDMDGVVIDMANAHAAVRQWLFDDYLKVCARAPPVQLRPWPRHARNTRLEMVF